MDTERNLFTTSDSNEITRMYFDSLLLETRYIDAGIPDTGLSLYGEGFKTPIMTAALSHLDKFYGCENGMQKMAQGAFDAGAVCWSGMGDDAELAAMCGTGARVIKIIKPYADEDLIYQQMAAAEKYGALAVGMDIDHSFNKTGQFDNVFGTPMRGISAADLAKYVQATKLPFIVKGVLSVQDAEKSLQAGAAGIVVSHHHGIIDSAVPPLMILPKIAALISGQIPIFADCGFSRGLEAFKALALGATAVSVGRSVIPALVKDGAAGLKNAITAMNAELAGVMARTGCRDLAHIDASVIWNR